MNTNELISHSRARFAHAAAKQMLKEKYQAKMLFAYNGGMWQAGPELLAVLKACPEESAVLLDLYETPVRVDVLELELAAQQRWQEQMNAWLIEYTELSNRR